jgi:hypothetical protein
MYRMLDMPCVEALEIGIRRQFVRLGEYFLEKDSLMQEDVKYLLLGLD